MAILSPPSMSTPRTTLTSRALFYCAFAASVFCLWTVFAWYQGLYEELTLIRQERDAALSTSRGREYEQKKQLEEMRRLKEKFGMEITEAHSKISEMNATGRQIGYENYDGGRLKGAEDVVIVIKTGATELYKNLPIHFSTTLPNMPNHLLFSDHEQYIGEHHIRDSLDESSEEAVKTYWDFQLYRDQQQYMALGQNPEFLEFRGGWELDKYKNVHIMAKTWREVPDAKWYMFIDADTYVVMSNLLPYLRNLDHNEKLYFGSPTYISNLDFAHGGTGYVISHAAVKAVMEKHPNIGHEYEAFAKDQCCGDYVLARALKDNDISLIWAAPSFNGEPPYKIELDKGKLCEPIVTLHHMLPGDMGEFWNYERQAAKPGEYLLFADVFQKYVEPHLQEERLDWDNMGGDKGDDMDIEKDEYKWRNTTKPSAFDRCKKACIDKEDCIQFRVKKDECKVTNNLMLGWKVPVSRDDNEDYKSGWLMDRVDELRKGMPCSQPPSDWPRDKIKH